MHPGNYLDGICDVLLNKRAARLLSESIPERNNSIIRPRVKHVLQTNQFFVFPTYFFPSLLSSYRDLCPPSSRGDLWLLEGNVHLRFVLSTPVLLALQLMGHVLPLLNPAHLNGLLGGPESPLRRSVPRKLG